MRSALLLLAAAAMMAASADSAFAQMAFPSSSATPREVLIEVPTSTSRQTINALLRRHRLTGLEAHRSQLAGTTVYRSRIRDRRSLANVVHSLKADSTVASAQPNYLYRPLSKHSQKTHSWTVRR